ncbi:MAG: hypothetical protein AAFN93_24005 [Bacteroidota bacterium]
MSILHISDFKVVSKKNWHWLLAMLGLSLVIWSLVDETYLIYELPIYYLIGTLISLIILVTGIAHMIDEDGFSSMTEKRVTNARKRLLKQDILLTHELKSTLPNNLRSNSLARKSDINKSRKSITLSEVHESIVKNEWQLRTNQVQSDKLKVLTQNIIDSKYRLLDLQERYTSRLDELENRLIINENGIILI